MDKNIFKSYSLFSTFYFAGIGIFLGHLLYLYKQGAFNEPNGQTMEVLYHSLFSVFGLLGIVMMGGFMIFALSKLKGY